MKQTLGWPSLKSLKMTVMAFQDIIALAETFIFLRQAQNVLDPFSSHVPIIVH